MAARIRIPLREHRPNHLAMQRTLMNEFCSHSLSRLVTVYINLLSVNKLARFLVSSSSRFERYNSIDLVY